MKTCLSEIYYGKKPEKYKILGKLKEDVFYNLKIKTSQIPKELWYSWTHKKFFSSQVHTLNIPIFNLPDFLNPIFNTLIKNDDLITLFDKELSDIFNIISEHYFNGEPKRVVFALLMAGKEIEEHIDESYHLENCRRIHVPINTDDKVLFYVDDVLVPMKENHIIEINNNIPHNVKNMSTMDRLHLIIDWGVKDDTYYNVQTHSIKMEYIT